MGPVRAVGKLVGQWSNGHWFELGLDSDHILIPITINWFAGVILIWPAAPNMLRCLWALSNYFWILFPSPPTPLPRWPLMITELSVATAHVLVQQPQAVKTSNPNVCISSWTGEILQSSLANECLFCMLCTRSCLSQLTRTKEGFLLKTQYLIAIQIPPNCNSRVKILFLVH
jgi:hypothetical protein